MAAGTDGAAPGHSLLHTLELFVEAGMTLREALVSASIVPTRLMGLDNVTGTIETGKSADFPRAAGQRFFASASTSMAASRGIMISWWPVRE